MQLFNSQSGHKETLTPLDDRHVRMYVCGMTVYDYCHIGHARVMVVFDTAVRYLRYRGYRVTYVRNITDIDDKIIKRAQELSEPISTLTERFIRAMHEDADALGVMRPDQEPRATEFMPQIVAMVQTLIAKGFAYAVPNGDVYYHVAKFGAYGALSREGLQDQRVGARVDVDLNKRDPLDFVLWKAAKPGEPSWPSPWGAGRPGWHIECSAMATHCLGNHFDIHGGGMDLKFPHHENEIAQSEAATGEKFVNLWMHNGFVQINDEKMSKSLHNFFTVREVLAKFAPEVLRYFILSSHYRGPLNYALDNLELAKAAVERIYLALRDVPVNAQTKPDPAIVARFCQMMDDDINTPAALTVLLDTVRELNRAKTDGHSEVVQQLATTVIALGALLGIGQAPPDQYLHGQNAPRTSAQPTDDEVEQLIAARTLARNTKNWQEADRLRDELQRHRILLEDSGGVTRWRRGS